MLPQNCDILNYSSFQEELYNKICDFKCDVFTSLGYRKISQILNNEGYKTPRNSIFKNTHVFSIYKKGNIRKERMEREDIVEVLDTLVQVFYPYYHFVNLCESLCFFV